MVVARKMVKKKDGSVTVLETGKNGGIVGHLASGRHAPTAMSAVPVLPGANADAVTQLGAANSFGYSDTVTDVVHSLARFYSPDLDEHEVDNLLYYAGRSEKWKPSQRKKNIVTPAEWDTFITEQELALRYPTRVVSRVLPDDERDETLMKLGVLRESYDQLSPTELANCVTFPRRAKYAYFALQREYTFVGLCHNPSPDSEEVKNKVREYRKMYYSLPADQRRGVPDAYEKGFHGTASGVPKDPGTVWAFHKVEMETFPHGTMDAGATFVAFDTETTGIHPSDGEEILQIGYGIYNSRGQLLDQESIYIRPDRTNPDGSPYVGDEGARATHGITPSDVENAESFPEAWARIAPKMMGTVIVGHNVRFDLRHMRAQLNRHNIVGEKGTPLDTSDVWWGEVDTLAYSRRHVDDVPNHKLTTLTEHFAIPLAHAHDAEYDAIAAGELFFQRFRG